MISTRRFRCEQQEDEVDWLVVECLEIDRALQPCEETKEAAELWKLAVRNCHSTPDPGRAEFFALKQNFQNFLLALTCQLGGARRQFLDRLLLAVNPPRGD